MAFVVEWLMAVMSRRTGTVQSTKPGDKRRIGGSPISKDRIILCNPPERLDAARVEVPLKDIKGFAFKK